MVETQVCQYCGDEYEPNPIGRKSIYCSTQCNNAVQNKKKSETVKAKIRPLVCEACEREFVPNKSGAWIKYCSRNCKQKAINFKRKYGSTVYEYNVLFDEQKGCCAICGVHQSKLEKTLHLDHCHETGDVRGLLCSACNLGLGQFKDDMKRIELAIEFLEGGKHG